MFHFLISHARATFRLDECKTNLNQLSPSPTTSQPPSSSSSPTGDAAKCDNKTMIEIGPNGGMVMPRQQVTVELDCPSINNSQRYPSIGGQQWDFKISCAVDYKGNDIGGAVAYSLDDCIWACAAMNSFAKNDTCRAVTFHAALSDSVARNQINCFLKNGVSNRETGKGLLVAGATLAGRTP